MDRQFARMEAELKAALDVNLSEGMNNAAAALAAHLAFPPSFDLIAVLKMTGQWNRQGKSFRRSVRNTASRLSKNLGRLQKSGDLANQGEQVALHALDRYEALASSRSDSAGQMIQGWVREVRGMYRAFGGSRS